ncbi:hypothetical protein BD809_10866 [Aquimarina intermedia]|uniref:Uncharacterized protein n=1 Tax=Aquimarina intermedia TaxID=350814 RepID=A0A5S5BZL9_9FLAO|nr:hypothetical protein BD809_10866 [Aquimarina intermedia]
MRVPENPIKTALFHKKTVISLSVFNVFDLDNKILL